MTGDTETTGGIQFYDRVSKRFGGYVSGAEYSSRYPDGDPESLFRSLLVRDGLPTASALDLGCADGRFTISVAPAFREVLGVDLSSGMLAAASVNLAQSGLDNVRFQRRDANQTGLEHESLDVVYCRRGPSAYEEVARVLRAGGAYHEITIGELDAVELKQVFGRGQGFDRFERSVLADRVAELSARGLRVEFAQSFAYEDVFVDLAQLSKFLEGVPIFEDFDPIRDAAALERYAAERSSPDGVALARHRVVLTARKPYLRRSSSA